ncbi:unnamed protein product [Symbiodinium pilosum]|uniref:Uncharacterized protein n=1 Tax=Symbiodinium pilosum TaxID=2952 RepID=A0A812KJ99_SYMPI|nr:unnamed protein product [Symbiodinium pilosum]
MLLAKPELYQDLWADARMAEVVQYLRGSKSLELASSWKNPFKVEWHRLVEYAIRKSKSNELIITCGWYTPQKMKSELGFDKRDKYERNKLEYWVEEMTKGQLKLLQEEYMQQKLQMSCDIDPLAEPGDGNMDLADCKDNGSSDTDTCSECNEDSDSESQTTPKKGRKNKKATKAIENAGTVLNQLLRIQARVDICAEKLEKLSGFYVKYTPIFSWALPRALATMNGYASSLSGYHDEIAEIKSSYTASRKTICQKSLERLRDIVRETEKTCARFIMEETKLKRTLLKPPSKKDLTANDEGSQAKRQRSAGPVARSIAECVAAWQEDLTNSFDNGLVAWSDIFCETPHVLIVRVAFATFAALVKSVVLADSDFLRAGAFEKRLDYFYGNLKQWAKQNHQYLHMTALTKDQLGADTTLLAKYLQTLYGCVLADCGIEEESFLEVIYDGLVAINKFMSSIYHQPLWVEAVDAGQIADLGMDFMKAFNHAAAESLNLGVPRFKIMPKFHFFAHLVHYMRKACSKGDPSLNVLAYSCQLDEDFIGRISGQSRQVSIRTVHERSIQRYFLNLGLRW